MAENDQNQFDQNNFRVIQPTDTAPRRRRVVSEAAAERQEAEGGAEDITQPQPEVPPPPHRQNTPIATTTAPAQPSRSPFSLRRAARAQRWQAFPSLKTTPLQQAQLFTVIALPLLPIGLHWCWNSLQMLNFQVVTRTFRVGMTYPRYEFPVPGLVAGIVSWLQRFWTIPSGLLPIAHLLDVVLLAAATFWAAPYFLGWVLQKFYGMTPLSLARLGQTSPEAQRRIQTAGQQQKIPQPQFGLLNTTTPIIFSYGSLPQTTRIVLSQGLLEQLSEDEIASVCSAEVSQIHPLNLGLMTWVMAILQVPYLIYWGLAKVGDWVQTWGIQQTNRALEIVAIGVTYVIAGVSSVAYGSFWVLRWAGLWLNRRRSFHADHAATNLTGNPNGQARALLKITHGISQAIQRQGYTDFLLEGWELAMPVGYRQALSLGSLFEQMSIEQALEWDLQNPQSQVLTVNNSHALLGDRLSRLMHYAQAWQLAPELELTPPNRQPLPWGHLLWAGLPFWGAAIGYLLAVAFWAIAWLGYFVNLRQLAWLGSDFRLFYGFPLLGFGLGTLLRFNSYFPDLPSMWQRRPAEPEDLAALAQDSLALPNRSRPTALNGKLLGRKGISNWLGQDLLLQTDRGLVRLHYLSSLGVIGNWAFSQNRPVDFVGQTVNVVGWLRRGATPWFDMELLRHPSGRVSRGGHQIWSTVLGAIVIGLGILWLGILEDLVSYSQKKQLIEQNQKLRK
jgi:Zn-dependent protease with chaperone function